MNQRRNCRRIDDDEIRSKMELLAELQTHQIELDMQNLELRKAFQELEESRDRYVDLYDHAPVGYLTLNKTGFILSINLTGATLLGKERALLIDKPFTTCVPHIDHLAFTHYLNGIFNSSCDTLIDLKIGRHHGRPHVIRLESSLMSDGKSCRMIMTDISQIKYAIQLNKNLLNENRVLMKNLFHAQEKERYMLACELHDELGQWLTAIHAEAETISNYTDKNSIVSASTQAIKECSIKMHEVIRSMLHKLRPELLDTLGLADALLEIKREWCSHHPQITLEFKLEDDLSGLDDRTSITIYRIIQESLNNICKHSEATWAQIKLGFKMDYNSAIPFLSLDIEDNGKGFDCDQLTTGIGLLGMRERAIAIGGTLSIDSVPHNGTRINVRLPFDNSNKKN